MKQSDDDKSGVALNGKKRRYSIAQEGSGARDVKYGREGGVQQEEVVGRLGRTRRRWERER